jgi:hypothetical protein
MLCVRQDLGSKPLFHLILHKIFPIVLLTILDHICTSRKGSTVDILVLAGYLWRSMNIQTTEKVEIKCIFDNCKSPINCYTSTTVTKISLIRNSTNQVLIRQFYDFMKNMKNNSQNVMTSALQKVPTRKQSTVASCMCFTYWKIRRQ